MNQALYSSIKQASDRHREKLDAHFSTTDSSRWKDFRKNLKAKSFVKAIEGDERSDDKMKLFSKMVNMHLNGKGPSTKVKGSSGKTYVVKYHEKPDQYSCSCPDWTYSKSLKEKGECRHIQEVKSQISMVKKASQAMRGLGVNMNLLSRYNRDETEAWHAKQIANIPKQVRRQRVANG